MKKKKIFLKFFSKYFFNFFLTHKKFTNLSPLPTNRETVGLSNSVSFWGPIFPYLDSNSVSSKTSKLKIYPPGDHFKYLAQRFYQPKFKFLISPPITFPPFLPPLKNKNNNNDDDDFTNERTHIRFYFNFLTKFFKFYLRARAHARTRTHAPFSQVNKNLFIL